MFAGLFEQPIVSDNLDVYYPRIVWFLSQFYRKGLEFRCCSASSIVTFGQG